MMTKDERRAWAIGECDRYATVIAEKRETTAEELLALTPYKTSAAYVDFCLGKYPVFTGDDLGCWNTVLLNAARTLQVRRERSRGRVLTAKAGSVPADQVCTRCGGSGLWANRPGYTCFDCGGSGIKRAA